MHANTQALTVDFWLHSCFVKHFLSPFEHPLVWRSIDIMCFHPYKNALRQSSLKHAKGIQKSVVSTQVKVMCLCAHVWSWVNAVHDKKPLKGGVLIWLFWTCVLEWSPRFALASMASWKLALMPSDGRCNVPIGYAGQLKLAPRPWGGSRRDVSYSNPDYQPTFFHTAVWPSRSPSLSLSCSWWTRHWTNLAGIDRICRSDPVLLRHLLLSGILLWLFLWSIPLGLWRTGLGLHHSSCTP